MTRELAFLAYLCLALPALAQTPPLTGGDTFMVLPGGNAPARPVSVDQLNTFLKAPPAVSSLAVLNPSLVTAGKPVSITLAHGLGYQKDWINIVPAGAASNALGTWAYLNGLQVPPTCISQKTCATNKTVSLVAPAAGSYQVRYMINDGFTVGAVAALTVKPAGTPPPTPLVIVFTPAAPSEVCTTAPAGTLVANLSTTGGNGNAVTWSNLTGDTAEFTLSGTTIVVGPSGLTCPVLPAVSKSMNLGVTANQ